MLPDEIIRQLHILPLDRLRSHEETIEFNLRKLRETMLNIGCLVDPLLVDARHNVVIDGNHRLSVLETLKCPNAACQIVDYADPKIRIGSWFPVSRTLGHGSIPGLKCEKVDFETGMAEIARMRGIFMYAKKSAGGGNAECYLCGSPESTVRSIVEQQRKALSSLEGKGLLYVPDDQHAEYLDAGYAVLYRKIYTKDEIISEAVAGRQMPPKSTRHMIPDRIIRLNMPLGWLSETPEIAKKLMDSSLRKRLTEGSIRRYTESVIVLY